MDLSPEKLAHDYAYLKEMRASQAWDIYDAYLEKMADDWTTRLINTSGPLDQLRFIQGVLAGLRIAQQVPETVESWVKKGDKPSPPGSSR